MLEIRQVHTFYGKIEALKGVDVTVERGKIVALLGGNGAGKTTLMKTIVGVLSPRSGSITFQGRNVVGRRPDELLRLGIALVPEGRGILSGMTVWENLQMGAYLRTDAAVDQDIAAVMERFPVLRERKRQLGGTLSGGQQQILAIARALLARPKLLLLDEPSMGLAPLIVRDILRIVQEIRENGTTVLLVEQNAKQALKIADYGYVLETGKIVMCGPAEQLLHDRKITEAYLGST
ncbi:MAG TPA: ABC transporter ATP-binding protein [Bacilli bacterium]